MSQRSPLYEETSHQLGGAPSKVSSIALSDIAAEQYAVDLIETCKQYDKRIQTQAEHICKVEADFHKFQGLMREYYLEMDMASVEDPPPVNEQHWFKRIRSLKL
ncbi:hypothetical protein BGX26_004121, partial [Mortierella sp. AD094]